MTKDLKRISDERGFLMEILRNDDACFQNFGQIYLTTTYPGVVKAWHYHKLQTDFFATIKGMIKLVCYDGREDSPTKGEVQEFFIGEQNPKLVVIPKRIHHGFKCISPETAYVINCPTHTYQYDKPDEYRFDPHSNDIPYDWSRKDG